MVNKSTLKNQFCELTGTSLSTAARYMDQADYNIAQAVDLYYNKHPSHAPLHASAKPSSNSYSAKLVAIYDKYKDVDNNEIIDIEGTIRYLEDLKIDPDNARALSLAFLLNSKKTGVFQRDCFLQVWSKYKIETLSAMSSFITKFHNDICYNRGEYYDLAGNSLRFKKLYDFTFGFLVESEGQKVLDLEIATGYWQLLLPIVVDAHLENQQVGEEKESIRAKVDERIMQWVEFLNSKPRKVISFDTWSMFLPFFQEVVLSDPWKFSGYDEMAAWPSKIDEYIEHLYDNDLLQNKEY
ncbi:uncharacterized protein LODBEIA_P31990 [Lodderomyces beijingensis]|uniref:Defective in cullin neddylation protein n=1 Tax=Lodderomyces beijingensis TaxID=1775926 RepID=A0ABP0ZP25_9ASCO